MTSLPHCKQTNFAVKVSVMQVQDCTLVATPFRSETVSLKTMVRDTSHSTHTGLSPLSPTRCKVIPVPPGRTVRPPDVHRPGGAGRLGACIAVLALRQAPDHCLRPRRHRRLPRRAIILAVLNDEPPLGRPPRRAKLRAAAAGARGRGRRWSHSRRRRSQSRRLWSQSRRQRSQIRQRRCRSARPLRRPAGIGAARAICVRRTVTDRLLSAPSARVRKKCSSWKASLV